MEDFLDDRQDLRGVDVRNEWKLIMTKREIRKSVKYCAKVINEKFVDKDLILVGILKGAIFFYVDLTRYLTIPYSCYFIEASSYLNEQTQDDNVEILSLINPSKFVNKHVILIDEIFDNGHTMARVKEIINQQAGVPMEKIMTCVLFKKNKLNHQEGPDLYGIEVPDVWLVGYGLDDNQEKRGWPHLYACPKNNKEDQTPDDKIFENPEFYDKVRSKLTYI